MSIVPLPIIDMRPQFGNARDQGARPTCLAFAMSDSHAKKLPTWSDLSCEFLFYQSKQIEKTAPQKGATVPSIRLALAQCGQPEESSWPYLPSLPSNLDDWVPPIAIGRLFQHDSTQHTANTRLLFSLLDAGEAVVTLLDLWGSFFSPGPQGVIRSGKDEAPDGSGLHAVISVGYGTVDRERYLLIRNSWGPGWGNNGYAWIGETILSKSLFGFVQLGD